MFTKLLEKLKRSRRRRELFVEGQIKTGIPFQVRALRDKKDWTQAQLGAELGMTQTNISRLESPGYGRLNITTLQRIASVFDVALIVRFVPFSELMRWTNELSPEVMAPASFEEELPKLEQVALRPDWRAFHSNVIPITSGVIGMANLATKEIYTTSGHGFEVNNLSRTYPRWITQAERSTGPDTFAEYRTGSLRGAGVLDIRPPVNMNVIDYSERRAS